MPTTLTKICGIRDVPTLDAAIAGGADYVGLVHYAPSPRHVDLLTAGALRQHAGRAVKVVLLLVNATPPETMAAMQAVRPDIIQFHGNETPEWLRLVRQHADVGIWKAIGLKDRGTLERARTWDGIADRVLYDAPAQALPGGNGTRVDWSILSGHTHSLPWGLAGGLNPDNVAEAIRTTRAPLVDVSSGVERTPGVKDVDKIAAFLQAARAS